MDESEDDYSPASESEGDDAIEDTFIEDDDMSEWRTVINSRDVKAIKFSKIGVFLFACWLEYFIFLLGFTF